MKITREIAEERGYECYDDDNIEELYSEFLDEAHGSVSVAGLEYETSDVLKEVDPTAFRCGCVDWRGEEFEEVHDGKDVFEMRKGDYEALVDELEDEEEEV